MNYPDYQTFKRMAETLLPKRWIFAKTMPKNPHWYTLLKEWDDPEEFYDMVALIREYGYKKKWGKRTYSYFDINDHRYWTMGYPVRGTTLINRAVLTVPAQYDAIAGRYDSLTSDEETRREDAAMMEMLPLDLGAVLDIGCGTGLFLGHRSPTFYAGIDPSQVMLDTLKEKHPCYGDRVIRAKFESFYNRICYDTIIALFGTASYIDPETLPRIKEMLSFGGQ